MAKLEGSQRVTLGGRGEVVPVNFDVTPPENGAAILSAAR